MKHLSNTIHPVSFPSLHLKLSWRYLSSPCCHLTNSTWAGCAFFLHHVLSNLCSVMWVSTGNVWINKQASTNLSVLSGQIKVHNFINTEPVILRTRHIVSVFLRTLCPVFQLRPGTCRPSHWFGPGSLMFSFFTHLGTSRLLTLLKLDVFPGSPW